MVYITGDTHANFSRFTSRNFPEIKEMTKDDIVIILGDFGGIWDYKQSSDREKGRLKFLEEKPCTFCFVDGNHENYDRLNGDEFPVVDFHGGKAHQIRSNIFHLMRGYIFDFESKSFFVMGGASSHDIQDGILDPEKYSDPEIFERTYRQWYNQGRMFRVNHVSWWECEIPSEEELERGKDTLRNAGYKVDYVLTHCLPQTVCGALGYYGSDHLTQYFDELLEEGLEFKEWHCGHHHRIYDALDKYHIHYEDIQRLL